LSGEIQNPLNLFNLRAGFKTRSKGKTFVKSDSNHAHNLKQDIHALICTSQRILYTKIPPIYNNSKNALELPLVFLKSLINVCI